MQATLIELILEGSVLLDDATRELGFVCRLR
jgi:hypothetical protein